MEKQDAGDDESRSYAVTATVNVQGTAKKREDASTEAASRPPAGIWRWWPTTNQWTAIGTVVAALAALRIMSLTQDAIQQAGRAADEAAKSNEIARQSLEGAQRAWIVPDWKQTISEGYFSDQAVSVWVKNAGAAAPTLNVNYAYKIIPDLKMLPVNFECPEPGETWHSLDQQILASQESVAVTMTYDLAKSTNLVGFVWLIYDDPYGRYRTTKFAFHVERNATGWDAKGSPSYGKEPACHDAK